MNIDIVIVSTLPIVLGTQVGLLCQVASTGGHSFDAIIPINFSASSTQINTDIINQVKNRFLEFGYTVKAQDRIKLFGGAV